MKQLILAISLLTLVGCATVDSNGDTASQAEVRDWFRSELIRIEEKKAVVYDMRESGQVSLSEFMLLMEACDNEKRSLPERARIKFGIR